MGVALTLKVELLPLHNGGWTLKLETLNIGDMSSCVCVWGLKWPVIKTTLPLELLLAIVLIHYISPKAALSASESHIRSVTMAIVNGSISYWLTDSLERYTKLNSKCTTQFKTQSNKQRINQCFRFIMGFHEITNLIIKKITKPAKTIFYYI